MIIVLLGLLMVALTERVLSPETKILKQEIESDLYQANQNQLLILQYHDFAGVYGMDLWEGIVKKDQKTNQTITDYSLKKNMNNSKILADVFEAKEIGCNAFQRFMIVEKLMEIQPQINGSEGRNYSFSDFTILEKLKKVLIVRDDYKLLLVDLIMNEDQQVESLYLSKVKDFSEYFNNTFIPNYFSQNILIQCDQDTNQHGILQFTLQDLPNLLFRPFQSNYQNYFKHFYLDNKLKMLFVAAGPYGVIIYNTADPNNLTELATIRPQQFLTEQLINIVQVRVNDEGTLLYALDTESGLFIFEIISPNSYKLKNLKIQLKQAQSFDFYGQTFFFIANTKTRQDYVLEVFIDFDQDIYYFNRLYQEDMEIFDVQVEKHWAVLIGKDIHKVVYHSVYRQFVSNFETSTFFEDVDLVQIEILNLKSSMPYSQYSVKDENEFNFQLQSDQSYFLGLSNDDIKLFSIHNIHPRVQCFNDESQKYEYNLVMNSTSCVDKKIRNDESSFSQCQIIHKFEFQSNYVYLKTKHKKKLIIGAIILGVFIIGLISLCFCCWKKWGKKLYELDLKRKQLKQESKYQEFNEAANIYDENQIV